MNPYLLEAAATSSANASIRQGRSRATRWSIGLIAAIGLAASALASATTWLLVTDPLTVAHAISTGDAEVFLRLVGAVLIDIVRILVGYL